MIGPHFLISPPSTSEVLPSLKQERFHPSLRVSPVWNFAPASLKLSQGQIFTLYHESHDIFSNFRYTLSTIAGQQVREAIQEAVKNIIDSPTYTAEFKKLHARKDRYGLDNFRNGLELLLRRAAGQEALEDILKAKNRMIMENGRKLAIAGCNLGDRETQAKSMELDVATK
ncbi:hypothetical protein BJ508DRAFT_326873 [Ascobolus immersus RN42]|uniref:Uncharacterized protein n=1 Tax=Ascobolus immersus RN42 TaxID=1160509 RepID=A0A3N4I8R9_ASCIM|nr:hypothetical protein BJ508DRAFT_326873 [Ascobolus immersus RN42]